MNSSLMARGRRYTMDPNHSSFIGAIEMQEQDKSADPNDVIDIVSKLGTSNNMDITGLKFVLPQSMTEQALPCRLQTSASTGELAIPHYQQILFSIANNFAGLADADIKRVMHFLKKTTTPQLIQLIRNNISHSSRAIAQGIFKSAIELGDARLIDLLLNQRSLDINVNQVWCYMEGYKYTPIERASYLRNKDVIEVLLNHDADVKRTEPSSHRYHGALEHAVHCNRPHDEYTNVDPQIFQMLLDKNCGMSDRALSILIRHRDGENAGLFMSANAHKNAVSWSSNGIFFNAILSLDQITALDVAYLILNIGADLNFDGPFGDPRDNLFYDAFDPYENRQARRVLDAAVQRGNLEMVETFLRSGALMTDKTLILAIAGGNYDLMRLLLDRGADVNSSLRIKLDFPNSPLAEAIRLQDAEAIRLLERYGPVNLDDETQVKAAIVAASKVGNLAFVDDLIQIGGQAKAKDLGFALSIAIKQGRSEVVTRLLDAGADLNQIPKNTRTPLEEAITRRDADLINTLLEAGALPSGVTESRGVICHFDTLYAAIDWGNRSIVEALILAGADVDYSQALGLAVERQNRTLVHILVESGSKAIEFNETLLAAALKNGDISMACYLLDRGADPFDTELLVGKAMVDSPKFLDLILEKHRQRFSVIRPKFGSKTLIWAITLGDQYAIRKMLEKGFDAHGLITKKWDEEELITLDTNGECSPFGYAILHSTVEVIEMFLQTGCNPNCIVFQTPRRGDTRHGDTSYRLTGFLAAIETRSLSKVKLLHKYAADVNFPAHTRVRHTPLQKAAAVGSTDIVEFLFRVGADVNAPASLRAGGTALQFAAIGGYILIIYLLLNQHADVNAPASKINGRMALEGAAEHGRLDMIQLLLNAGAGNEGKDLAQFERAKALANKEGFSYIADFLDDYLQRKRAAHQPAMLADGIDDEPGMENPDKWMEDVDWSLLADFD